MPSHPPRAKWRLKMTQLGPDIFTTRIQKGMATKMNRAYVGIDRNQNKAGANAEVTARLLPFDFETFMTRQLEEVFGVGVNALPMNASKSEALDHEEGYQRLQGKWSVAVEVKRNEETFTTNGRVSLAQMERDIKDIMQGTLTKGSDQRIKLAAPAEHHVRNKRGVSESQEIATSERVIAPFKNPRMKRLKMDQHSEELQIERRREGEEVYEPEDLLRPDETNAVPRMDPNLEMIEGEDHQPTEPSVSFDDLGDAHINCQMHKYTESQDIIHDNSPRDQAEDRGWEAQEPAERIILTTRNPKVFTPHAKEPAVIKTEVIEISSDDEEDDVDHDGDFDMIQTADYASRPVHSSSSSPPFSSPASITSETAGFSLSLETYLRHDHADAYPHGTADTDLELMDYSSELASLGLGGPVDHTMTVFGQEYFAAQHQEHPHVFGTEAMLFDPGTDSLDHLNHNSRPSQQVGSNGFAQVQLGDPDDHALSLQQDEIDLFDHELYQPDITTCLPRRLNGGTSHMTITHATSLRWVAAACPFQLVHERCPRGDACNRIEICEEYQLDYSPGYSMSKISADADSETMSQSIERAFHQIDAIEREGTPASEQIDSNETMMMYRNCGWERCGLLHVRKTCRRALHDILHLQTPGNTGSELESNQNQLDGQFSDNSLIALVDDKHDRLSRKLIRETSRDITQEKPVDEWIRDEVSTEDFERSEGSEGFHVKEEEEEETCKNFDGRFCNDGEHPLDRGYKHGYAYGPGYRHGHGHEREDENENVNEDVRIKNWLGRRRHVEFYIMSGRSRVQNEQIE